MSDRTQKIGNEIARELAPILDEAAKQLLKGALATIMEVKVSPDLGVARIFVSIYNTPDKKKAMAILNENKATIRKYLAQQMRHTLRRIPEINFSLDETIDTAQRIEGLLKNIQKEDNSNE